MWPFGLLLLGPTRQQEEEGLGAVGSQQQMLILQQGRSFTQAQAEKGLLYCAVVTHALDCR